MAIIKNIHGAIMRQDDMATVKETLEAWVAEFCARGEPANLSYADLSYANLSYADLSSANLHFLGNCSRGYGFYLYFEPQAVIRAGCRVFTMKKAIAHWTTAHEDDLILRAEILGKLECAKIIIAAREAAKSTEKPAAAWPLTKGEQP